VREKKRGEEVKRIYSEPDNRGMIYVDCTECERGANGSDKDKCSAGWRYKKGGMGGCFAGTLTPEIAERLKEATQ
jgi:hypothetical protein